MGKNTTDKEKKVTLEERDMIVVCRVNLSSGRSHKKVIENVLPFFLIPLGKMSPLVSRERRTKSY